MVMTRNVTSALGVIALSSMVSACNGTSAAPAGFGARVDTGVATQGIQPALDGSAAPLSAGANQWVISCGPSQQAQVRSTVQNGVQTSEVTCVDVAVRPTVTRRVAAAPAAVPSPSFQTVAYRDDEVSLDDPVTYRPATTSSVRTRPAVYTVNQDPERPVRRPEPKRSWQKSAVIIGSSAGAGAGVGAMVGGKKGALIGAAVGGGGAALWDQITRRKNDNE
jgi:hypothetical protein